MSALTSLSDEAKRKLLKPQPTSHEQILNVAQSSFLLDKEDSMVILNQLDSYDDVNYLVERTSDRTKFLLKIHNGVESADYVHAMQQQRPKDDDTAGSRILTSSAIHLQNAMMQYLNQNNIRTSDPLPVVSADTNNNDDDIAQQVFAAVHSLPVVSQEHSPQPLVVRLLSWIPGRTMASLPTLPVECLMRAGVYLGRLDGVLDRMDKRRYEASSRYHAWDGKHTADLQQYVHCIDDPRRRAMVCSLIQAFRQQDFNQDTSQFRTGLLQADFNDANILVNDDFEIAGVIDFGDSVSSWRVLDISVAMAYAMLSQYGKRGRTISAAAAILRGFHSVYPLQAIERKHLPLLVACRLACSASIGAFSYQQNPENEYLLLHAEPAWEALETIWGYDDDKRPALHAAVLSIFDRACEYTRPSNRDKDEVNCADLAFPDPRMIDPLASIRVVAHLAIPTAKRQKVELSSANGKKVSHNVRHW